MKQKTLKIAFDASPMLINRTGIANYIEHLVTALAAAYPNEIKLLGFYYNFLGRRSATHMPTAPNIAYRRSVLIPSKIVYQLRRWGLQLPVEALTKGKSDFILFGNFLGYPSLFRTPAAPVIHDLTYLDLPEYVAAKNRSDLVRFVPQQINRSSFVVTVSEFSKQKIVETYGVDPSNILVTPIPPATPLQLSDAKCGQTLADLHVTKPYILFVGTIEPRKNVLGLVNAFLQLPEEIRQQHQLVIAGRIGWSCEQEEARLTELNNDVDSGVRYVGFIDNQARGVLYKRARLFASASHYEGFGMPVLEAMSYGVPCVVSDIGVFREVAEDSALYFDQNNAASIANTLQQALSDQQLLERLGVQGKAQSAKYNWYDLAAQLMSFIRRAMDAKK